MKILFGIILIAICTFTGKIIANKYTKIKIYYEDFYNFNRILLNKISFSNSSITEVLNTNKNESPFIETAKDYFINNNITKIDFISSDDNKYLYRYLNEIGKSNRTNQIEFLTIIDNELRDRHNLSIENEKKYKPLYIKLGFLFGLIVFIVIL